MLAPGGFRNADIYAKPSLLVGCQVLLDASASILQRLRPPTAGFPRHFSSPRRLFGPEEKEAGQSACGVTSDKGQGFSLGRKGPGHQHRHIIQGLSSLLDLELERGGRGTFDI